MYIRTYINRIFKLDSQLWFLTMITAQSIGSVTEYDLDLSNIWTLLQSWSVYITLIGVTYVRTYVTLQAKTSIPYTSGFWIFNDHIILLYKIC